jgi:exopolyphosphatase / guanosine-5'-triphosphate,3'-diphosphate pyrophosphatase
MTPDDEPALPSRELAAIDLGSNSFHMIVARDDGDLHVIDRLRERVALAEGVDGKRIQDEAVERALRCLGRFGERIQGIPARRVRVVGTNTLRKARNAREFIRRAEEALGHRIEVISGQEEARLIYQGVVHDVADSPPRRMVIDIGGGSTEFILGQGPEAVQQDSIQMGCVRWKRKFFADGVVDERAMDRARIAARLEMRAWERSYRALGWDACVGASGTIRAVHAILRANGWSDRGITSEGLDRMVDRMIEIGTINKLKMPGLAADRRSVIAPGAAILQAVFRGLHLQEMRVSDGALREGLLHDLRGRRRHEDVRDRTIRRFQSQHSVDLEHASRVHRTAMALFDQGAAAWGLDGPHDRRFLSWAAQLHELGLSVSHGGYHRHGAYLLRNATMPGFSRDDQEMLSALVLGHRRRLTRERLEEYLPRDRAEQALRLCVFLRLAVRIHRTRSARRQPEVSLEIEDHRLGLGFPGGWIDEHPLTRADLDDERFILAAAGFELKIV